MSKQRYVVRVPFVYNNVKQSAGQSVELAAKQAANLLAGGFIEKPAKIAVKNTAKASD